MCGDVSSVEMKEWLNVTGIAAEKVRSSLPKPRPLRQDNEKNLESFDSIEATVNLQRLTKRQRRIARTQARLSYGKKVTTVSRHVSHG